MPTLGRPATSRCRKRRGCCCHWRRVPPRRRWCRWPKPGGHGAAPRRACCGATIAPPRSARARPFNPPNHFGDEMAAELDGPPLDPQAGAARQLIVFLHGYGADGNDLIDIGPAWQKLLPHAAFVSPHAADPCSQSPTGRQWFPLSGGDPNERWTGANNAAPEVERFLDAELSRRNLPPSALAFVGFSQGTMMALHVGLRRSTKLMAIVGYSGLLILPPNPQPEQLKADIKSRPPILLIHGDR